MIFYFSGTGNSAWCAHQLAHLLDDVAYDITDLKKAIAIQDAQRIGFVFPVHAWGVPEPMLHFIKQLAQSNAFTFAICTCGGDAGYAMRMFAKYYPLDSAYSLLMPNNYVIGSDIETDETILTKLHHAKKELTILAQEIQQEKKVNRVKEGSFAALKTYGANKGFNQFARGTKAFHVQDSCNHCGQCAKQCPAHAITMHDGKPVWKKHCYKCMRCIHACPCHAIQYGTQTKKRRRYQIDHYLKLLD